jgi:2-polyprenyl-6-methoxyphenol hydroxylase-like FAD-dependent oxidoreductase
MSPIGGVGINLAIQDAVAAANELAEPLLRGKLRVEHLAAVQRRRMFPTRVTQRLQVLAQERIIYRVLNAQQALEPPWALRALDRWPRLRRIPARLIGIGVRPEHVRPSSSNPGDRD